MEQNICISSQWLAYKVQPFTGCLLPIRHVGMQLHCLRSGRVKCFSNANEDDLFAAPVILAGIFTAAACFPFSSSAHLHIAFTSCIPKISSLVSAQIWKHIIVWSLSKLSAWKCHARCVKVIESQVLGLPLTLGFSSDLLKITLYGNTVLMVPMGDSYSNRHSKSWSSFGSIISPVNIAVQKFTEATT